jgi:hypothetical protein
MCGVVNLGVREDAGYLAVELRQDYPYALSDPTAAHRAPLPLGPGSRLPGRPVTGGQFRENARTDQRRNR